MSLIGRGRTADAVARLADHLDAAQILTEGHALEVAAAVWNGAVAHRPALVVRCRTTDDVQHAVRAARDAGLPLSVRGGGHDWVGRAIRPDGLVVDLTEMRGVSVHDGVATVAGGATSADVAEAADAGGLGAVVGTVGDVGMVGLSLAGGYGPYCGAFGLAADNLLAAQVVLADGRVAHAGHDESTADSELLWALRGGGGNFGVVTSVDVALHPMPTILAGSFTFSGQQAHQVLTGYAEFAARAPDELTVSLTILAGPDGEPAVLVSPTWCGAPDEGRAAVEEFATVGTPLDGDVSEMSPLTKLRQLDGMFPVGAQYAIRTRNLATLTRPAASTMVEAYAARTSAGSFVNIHHFHGVAARRAVAETAFAQRADHLMVEFIEAGPTVSAAWTGTAGSLLAPHALPGGYPNLLAPDDVAQTEGAYGPNAARLLEVKDRFDPDGVFDATPLPRLGLAATRSRGGSE